MNVLTVASPALRVLFQRLGRPDVVDLPDLLKRNGSGAVIVCNHVGWADSLWLGYAVYPRQIRTLSKMELFSSPVARWVMEQGGSISLNREYPSPSSIKAAVDLLRQGELILIFPSGTRSREQVAYKRGAATIALHAQAPIVPAFYKGPKHMHVAHLMDRPRIQLTFGPAIPTLGLQIERATAISLTHQLQASIENLRSEATPDLFAA